MNAPYINDDGTPNLKELVVAFNRCAPSVAGGLAWMDNTRFCRWPNQWTDGKKHDANQTAAFPFDGASDVRPMTVDDIINERAAMKTTAFWMAQASPGAASAEDDAGSYAVALMQHLIFEKMFYSLTRETELSAQYEEQYGWMVLAPRWKRQIGIKKSTVTLAALQQQAQALVQQQMAAAQPQPPGGAQNAGQPPDSDPIEQVLISLADAILDPSREQEAAGLAMEWYDHYIKAQLPEEIQDNAPTITKSQALKAVRDLRSKGEASVPLPYLALNEPEISALKPWDEVFIPPELTTENEIIFMVERKHEVDLMNLEITENYDKEWVELARKQKGAMIAQPQEVRTGPLGIGGMVGGAGSTPVFSAQPTINNNLIEIVHAIYHGFDDDGIPAVYCTTFHRNISDKYAQHIVVEGAEGELPFSAGVREWWCRSITASRGVPERAHTQQNIIKGILDSTIDRASITTMPPVNVYESPTGAQYKFGPAKQNYVRQGREPQFMEGPSGEGMADATEVLTTIRNLVDNSYGLMSPDVGPARLQMSQGMAVRRFLMTWYKAFKQVLNLYLIHGDDAEFAAITGAPPGWLEAHREETDCLTCTLHFDVRELDPELMLKRIETVNTVVLPNDMMQVVDRGEWTNVMMKAVMGPMAARRLVLSKPDAGLALKNKTEAQVLKMFAGNPPDLLDQDDPSAGPMLQMTQQNVLQNPNYLQALDDDALTQLAGTPQQAQMLAQQVQQTLAQTGKQRNPDPVFSGHLQTWLKNLKFIGVTQQQNKMRGRQGV